jgi:hypothetical protein
LFIRLQAEKEMGLHGDDISNQEAKISRLSKCLPESKNTRIALSIVRKYSREWQAQLQNISDFLLEGEGVWWSKDDEAVELHDINNFPSQQESRPQLHHFRSTTLKDEATYIQQCWKSCLDLNIPIPIHLLRIDQPNGTTCRIYTEYLGDKLPEVRSIVEEHQHLNQESLNTEILEEDQEIEENIIEIIPLEDEIIDLQEPDVPIQEPDVLIQGPSVPMQDPSVPIPPHGRETITSTDKCDDDDATTSHIAELDMQHENSQRNIAVTVSAQQPYNRKQHFMQSKNITFEN